MNKKKKNNMSNMNRGVRAQSCVCKRDRLWVRIPLEEIQYLIFSFLRYKVEAKRGVKFRPSTRNASKIRRIMGNGVS